MIDYNETRGISKETLNELLQELNPDFIKNYQIHHKKY